MIYKRPQLQKTPTSKTVLSITRKTDYELHDSRTGAVFPKNIQIIETFSEIAQDGYIYGKTPGNIDYSDLIARCCSVAETLNQKLLSFLLSYYNESKHKELYVLDFMKLRDILSEIVKNDSKISQINKLKTAGSRKTFRKLFAQFIEDRNIYTHGELVYRKNDNQILIKYIDKKSKKFIYSIVNKEIIKSYFELYKYLSESLALIQEHLKNSGQK